MTIVKYIRSDDNLSEPQYNENNLTLKQLN